MVLIIILAVSLSVAFIGCASQKKAPKEVQIPATTTTADDSQSNAKKADAHKEEKGKEPITHVVQQGETLSIIAKQYNVTVDAIVKLNNIADANLIKVGQKLLIPESN
jgi:LysM repeat protein